MFTASGVVLALLALAAIIDGDWTLALIYLLVALAVDGIDGTLARAVRIKERVPRIDGAALDLIVDYLNYVFVPTLFIWRAGLVPEALAPYLAAAIQVSSLYIFARTDMKTDDGYFRGFPALWNIVAFYLYVGQPGADAGAAIVAVLVVLTFAPVHFVHPFRVRDYGAFLPFLALFWAAVTVGLLWFSAGDSVGIALVYASSGSGLVLIALGLLRTFRGARPAGLAIPSAKEKGRPA
jgi:phosphatidylcholine synthase